MADWTAYSYLRTDGKSSWPWKGSGVMAAGGGVTFGGTPRAAWTASGTVAAEGAAQITAHGQTEYLLHAIRSVFDHSPDGPLRTRLVNGMGGRGVPWGVLVAIAEAEEGDVRTWTATFGPNTGKTVGMALENPRTSVTLQAIFMTGTPPPQRGSIFLFQKSDGTVARLICLKKSFLWSQGGWLALQIDGTAWDGSMSRIN